MRGAQKCQWKYAVQLKRNRRKRREAGLVDINGMNSFGYSMGRVLEGMLFADG